MDVVTVWILATVLERGAKPQISIWPTEQQCVDKGQEWEEERAALAARLKRSKFVGGGWLCTTAEENPS